jgi:hypothetical protein
VSLGVGSFLDRGAEQRDGAGVEFVGGIGFVVLEPRGEFVRVLKDLVNCAGSRARRRRVVRSATTVGQQARSGSVIRTGWRVPTRDVESRSESERNS